MAEHTFISLIRRLSRAGFKETFVRPAILPDWWDESCAENTDLLPDIEVRVARFLGLSLSAIRSVDHSLQAPKYPDAQLRRVRDVDIDRLAPAIHAAMSIAGAVCRSLNESAPSPSTPPADGIEWRNMITRDSPVVSLDDLLGDLWQRGIPVVPIDLLPTPNFQGLACIVEDRPVIVLGYKHDEPGRVAFRVAHEAGHIVAGDCLPDQPVVDEEEIPDESDIELSADQYATHTLAGANEIPKVDAGDFRELAEKAAEVEAESGVNAGAIIFAWASRTGDYANASMAVKALYRASGARRLLRQHFDRYADLTIASESDRALLRCVYGDPESDASAD